MSIVIIGTGFAGIGMAIGLKRAGIEDFVVLEKGSGVGGTWRYNDYPGCACDVQSHVYSYSFEPKPDWSRMFAPQAEILRYIQHCADKYGVMPHIRFGSRVDGARYDEASAEWVLSVQPVTGSDGATEAGPPESLRARVLVPGLGALHKPSIPAVPGTEDFAGPRFHSARWDHGCELSGKRVAVIGTGASAIQFVPEIAKVVGHIDVYQRSAPWIIPKPDRDVEGWEQRMFRAMPATQRMARSRLYWRNESRILGMVVDPKLMKWPERAARRYLERVVADPELREKLTPDYPIGCKRILLSNNWLQTMVRPNVDVVTTGIERVVPEGLLGKDGELRPADVIIYGTGFVTQTPVREGTIFGRGGRDLGAEWAKLPQAYKGCTVEGFPNLFFLGGPNTSLGHNSIIYMHESQIAYVLDAIETMRGQGLRAVEVRKQAQDDYNAWIRERCAQAVWQAGCDSWYVNDDGIDTVNWPDFTFRFRKQLSHFDVAAYELEGGALETGESGDAAARSPATA